MERNNYAENEPTVVLYVPLEDEPQALVGKKGTPRVFKNFKKASHYVANFISAELRPFIQYVNETPRYGAGDEEDTDSAKCIRCGTQLIWKDAKVTKVGGEVLEIAEYYCPECKK